MLTVLVEQPLLTLFLVLTVGTLLGAIRVAGTSIGPAGALFAGLAVSAAVPDVSPAVPQVVGTLGLALFVYTVGIAGGPSFFGGLRRGAPAIGLAVGTYVLVAVVAWGLGTVLGLAASDVAGTYAGAGTNTSALAAVVEVVGDPSPAVGYSLAYPFGVVGMIVAVSLALGRARRRPTAEDAAPDEPPTYVTVVVSRDDLPPVTELTHWEGETLVFSRVRRDGEDHTPAAGERFEPGDLVTVIGTPAVLRSFVTWIGGTAEEDLVLDRRQIDFRRAVLSNPRHAGATIGELGLDRFDAVAGFVRRGDVDVIARDDLVVELGDRIRVIAPRERMPEVMAELGDSERAVVVADPIGFSLGLLLGLVAGLIAIPLPGRTLVLGAAAGPLLVGLVLGRLGRTGPVVWQLPYATNQTLRQLGALLFLAVIGLGAGPELAAALTSARGLQLLGLGIVLTTLGAAGILVGARMLGAGGPRAAGTIAGAQGQPAVLAAAVDRTGGDDRVALTYALLFPPVFLVKIVAAQVLATL
ncbi:aspartate:alanine exchanger family transporter [Nitriliruptor alkaliphilus]|uniref:aspartate:alanine exchanger family transporter n=1 Tax=Nitriliruptor alkaliphilus TaxID=427918 RepID=UPI0006972AC4|nr:TrkA C-terminal domain-containing protein [Nitriliruptor alkaliphilus]